MYYGRDGRYHPYKETPGEYRRRKNRNWGRYGGGGSNGGGSFFFWIVVVLLAVKLFF